jgi:branched-chain amino acid transport system permease protein
VTPEALAAARARAAAHGRWRPAEALVWLGAVAAYFAFPGYMALGAQVLIVVLFALSLDLILGYAGIVSLGHAAYFGVGAYAAGMLSAHLQWHEPLTGLAFAGLCAAAYGFVTGWILLRYHGLTLLMLTLVAAILLHEAANAWSSVTGGFDGLLGIAPAPLLGVFAYDLWGHTHYWYALAVLFLCFLAARQVVHSPFGRSLVGLRENTRRMHALGAPVHARLVLVYTLSCGMAGIAGGLFAQTNAFVTMDVMSFLRSGTVIIVLILGGLGRLYGAFLGGVVYTVLEDQLAKGSPEFWEFGIGLALVALVLFARDGLTGLALRGWQRLRRPA